MIPRFSDRASAHTEAPLREPVEFSVASLRAGENTSKIEKTPHPQFSSEQLLWEFWSPTIWRVSPHLNERQPTAASNTEQLSGIEHKIISSIETFRKEN